MPSVKSHKEERGALKIDSTFTALKEIPFDFWRRRLQRLEFYIEKVTSGVQSFLILTVNAKVKVTNLYRAVLRKSIFRRKKREKGRLFGLISSVTKGKNKDHLGLLCPVVLVGILRSIRGGARKTFPQFIIWEHRNKRQLEKKQRKRSRWLLCQTKTKLQLLIEIQL